MSFSRSMWKFTLAACFAAPFAQANAQGAPSQTVAIVRGTVTDSTNHQPVIGVQVIAVGTTRGAVTDTAGAYTLRVPPGPVTIRAQRIGYAPSQRTITATLDGTETADFVLHPVSTVLSEVVVTGYGTQNRADVTGAVTTVSGQDIQDQPVAGVDAALQGRAAGVQVSQNSGEPGTGISVRIRGAASLSASNQPLYVVDGVPIANDPLAQQLFPAGSEVPTAITGLDPNEIESITVLKDAASAAIYGSRASNGVIMITTKRGQAGKARFKVDLSTGIQKAATKLKLMNATQYVTYMNEGAVNDGDGIQFFAGIDDATSTDWQDAIFRSAPVSNLHLGLSGGSETLRYNVEGSFFKQQGIVIGSAYNRANARVNVDYDATSKFRLKTSIGLARENNDRIEGNNSNDGIVTNAIGQPAVYHVRNPDGSFTSTADTTPSNNSEVYSNPVAIGTYDRLPSVTDHILGNVEGNYLFNSHLTLTGSAGVDILHDHEDQWRSPLVVGNYAYGAHGVAMTTFDNTNHYLLQSYLTYQAGSQDASNFTVVGGGSIEYNHEESSFLRGEGFSSPEFQYVGSATNLVDFGGIPSDNNLESFFARANYSYKDRYLLQGSLRADGSSRFGVNNRWGYFPAVSAGWVISNEPFMGNFGNRFGQLKLRGSFGKTGNQSIPNFAALATYGSANYGGTPGIAPLAFANPNLKWETTKEWDGGIDYAPFGGRLTIIADYYHKATSDLLTRRQLPCTIGYCSFFDNIGNVLNRGFEFGLNSENVRPSSRDGFSWATDFNISFNHNEVTKLNADQPVTGDNYRDISRAAVGQPIGEFYVLHFKGVDPATGDALYSDERINAGNPQPKYWGGLGNTVGWKGFQLRGFLEFSQGAKIFNLMRIFADDGGYSYDNKYAYAMNRWQNPGDITNEPRASFDGTSGGRVISDRFIEDGSYIRIQDITLSWRLPAGLFAMRGLGNAKLYVSGHNLHTFTKYTGYDPDVNSNGTSNIDLGTDYYAYPRARTFTLGISGEF
jgi:TonB-linked SusC/RagA family outer membrane protein